MATRKTAPKGRKPRPGLRSQVKVASEEEAAWNSVETTEDEEGASSFPKVPQSPVNHRPSPSLLTLQLARE